MAFWEVVSKITSHPANAWLYFHYWYVDLVAKLCSYLYQFTLIKFPCVILLKELEALLPSLLQDADLPAKTVSPCDGWKKVPLYLWRDKTSFVLYQPGEFSENGFTVVVG